MKMIYEMIRATNGKQDGDKAMAAIKGYAWESPRVRCRSIRKRAS